MHIIIIIIIIIIILCTTPHVCRALDPTVSILAVFIARHALRQKKQLTIEPGCHSKKPMWILKLIPNTSGFIQLCTPWKWASEGRNMWQFAYSNFTAILLQCVHLLVTLWQLSPDYSYSYRRTAVPITVLQQQLPSDCHHTTCSYKRSWSGCRHITEKHGLLNGAAPNVRTGSWLVTIAPTPHTARQVYLLWRSNQVRLLQ